MPHLLELYCGTKSVGRVFEQNGWTVTSVDILPCWNPDICCDILDLTPEMVLAAGPRPDLIHGSPPCTHYSGARTHAKTPRDLVGSDRMVQKVLDLAAFFNVDFFMENPYRGLLKWRDVVRGIPVYHVDYCQYGDDSWPGYMKPTCIWHTGRWRPQRALCTPKTCRWWGGGKRGQGGRHVCQAQCCKTTTLYALPAALPQEWCDAYAGVF